MADDLLDHQSDSKDTAVPVALTSSDEDESPANEMVASPKVIHIT